MSTIRVYPATRAFYGNLRNSKESRDRRIPVMLQDDDGSFIWVTVVTTDATFGTHLLRDFAQSRRKDILAAVTNGGVWEIQSSEALLS